MKNPQIPSLAIVIPTYNRAGIVYDNLQRMLPEIIEHSVHVYISDDSDNDATKTIVGSLSTQTNRIHYKRNTPALGHDKNCFATLMLAQQDYVWYLGDGMFIESGGIKKVISTLTGKGYSHLIVNSRRRKTPEGTIHFQDSNQLLAELGWHITMTGATIYSKQSISPAMITGPSKNFPQTALILYNLNTRCSVLYDSNIMIDGHPQKKSYWSKDVLNVFCDDWTNFIMSLPSKYQDQAKKTACKAHSRKTGVLDSKALFAYRRDHIFSFSSFIQHYRNLRLSSNATIASQLLASILPPKLAGAYVAARLWWKKKRHQ